MIGIILPSIELSMTMHPDHLMKPGPDTTPPEPSADEESGLWLHIGDDENIATKDPLIFRTSPLLVGERAGDERVIGLPGTASAYPLINRRQSPARKGSP